MPGIEHSDEMALVLAKADGRDRTEKGITGAQFEAADEFKRTETRQVRAGPKRGDLCRVNGRRAAFAPVSHRAASGEQDHKHRRAAKAFHEHSRGPGTSSTTGSLGSWTCTIN